jgi:ABC-2 type transport system ATP-binding protein
MGDPPVLLLDEPTDGLDPAGKKAARELLRELAREGRAVMLNSHLLGEVEATCDQVVIIKEGRVLAHGPTAELLAAKSAVYRLRLAEPPGDELLAALRATCPDAALQPDGALLLPLEAHEQLDEVVDLLRARGARLRELRPRATLEDVFLELVGQEGGA